MKRSGIILAILFLGIAFNGFSQTAAPADFFAGKWEIVIFGTPNGDSKMVTELIRKDGKLTGELKDPTGQNPEAFPLTNIVEAGNKVTLYFTAQGTDVNLDLEKVDDDHLKGSIMNGMFDATGVRVKP
ncbi:MAG: hypothetical protein ABIN80_26630 [Dyadobacter sp.]|uniref:hypothetical protein n=1 Tax=Dyadobacter sp. TaxID=1914288 RepID=UPI0032654BB5